MTSPSSDQKVSNIQAKKLSASLIVHAFISFSLLGLALQYTAMIVAASLCSGWNEGTMSVTTCSVDGIKGLADGGYALGLFSSFFFGIPFLLPGLISFIYFRYWRKEKKDFIGDRIYYYIARIGVWSSGFAIAIFIGVPIAFILFGSIHTGSVALKESDLRESAHMQLLVPAANRFICDENSVLEITNENKVIQHYWGEYYEAPTIGIIQADEKTFTWHEFGYQHNDFTVSIEQRYRNMLGNCKNIEDKTVFDLYKELPMKNFYFNR